MNKIVRFFGFLILFNFCSGYGAFAQQGSANDLLKKIVEIESGTAQPDNIDKVQDIIKGELESMGFSVELKSNSLGKKSGKLLVATLTGEKPDFISFLAHADTVFEPSSGFKGFNIQGDIVRGPGIIDDKGGVVVALTGLKKYLAVHKKPLFSMRFIVSPSEETGSSGFLDEFKKFSGDSKLLLGFEPSLDDGSIVESRRGNRWYLIKVTGREAHAGRDHKKGINACLDLAGKIQKISSFTDYKRNVTVSIGRMEGGQDKFNIVCGSAQAKIDTRFGDLKTRDRLQKQIEGVLQGSSIQSAEDHTSAKLEYEIVDDCPPFSVTSEGQKYIKAYQQGIYDVEKVKPKSMQSGGSADSNYFSRPGIVIIDGLGATGGGMHTKDEHLLLSSLETRAEALNRFLGSLKSLK